MVLDMGIMGSILLLLSLQVHRLVLFAVAIYFLLSVTFSSISLYLPLCVLSFFFLFSFFFFFFLFLIAFISIRFVEGVKNAWTITLHSKGWNGDEYDL